MERGGPDRPATRPMVPRGLQRASEFSWRLLIVAAALLAVGWALSKVFLVVVVFIAALLLTTLLNPLAARLRRRGWNTGLATAASMISGLMVLGIVGWLVAPAVIDEFGQVGKQAAVGVREAQRWLVNGPLHLSPNQVDNIANRLVDQLRGGGGSSIVGGVVSGALAVGEVVAAILLTIVVTVFLVRDGRQIWNWLVGLLPRDSRPRAHQIGQIAWDTLSHYIRGIAIIGAFDAILIGIGLLALGVPLVLPLMLLTFIGAFVPLAGSTVAGFISALVALVDEGLVAALVLVGIIILVQQVEGHVMYPVVMRRAVAVHPVPIILGVAAGALLMGIFGAIVAVPVVGIAGRVLAMLREQAGEPPPMTVPGEAVLLGEDGERRTVSAQEALSAASSRSTSA